MLSLKHSLLHSHSWRCGRFDFRLQPLALLLTLAAFSLLIKLGLWQLQRADDKTEMLQQAEQMALAADVSGQALFSGDDVEHGRYHQTGVLQFEFAMLLDNRSFEGRPGYHVIVPFQPHQQSGLVLVNIGWLPMGQDRRTLPEVLPIEKEVQIAGRLKSLAKQTLVLSEQIQPVQPRFPLRVQKVDPKWIEDWSGQDVAPWLVLLDEDLDWGYPRKWQLATMPVEKHIGYAVQWFGLALVLLVIAVRWMVKGANED